MSLPIFRQLINSSIGVGLDRCRTLTQIPEYLYYLSSVWRINSKIPEYQNTYIICQFEMLRGFST
ncbi:hypothetical protein V6Z11_D07G173000 [Gossypium hirsutum]